MGGAGKGRGRGSGRGKGGRGRRLYAHESTTFFNAIWNLSEEGLQQVEGMIIARRTMLKAAAPGETPETLAAVALPDSAASVPKKVRVWERPILSEITKIKEWGAKSSAERSADKESTKLSSIAASAVSRGSRQGLTEEQMRNLIVPLVDNEVVTPDQLKEFLPAVTDDQPKLDYGELCISIQEFLKGANEGLIVPDIPSKPKRRKSADGLSVAELHKNDLDSWVQEIGTSLCAYAT